MDGRGRCIDNIFVERLWQSLKYEGVHLNPLESIQNAWQSIANWIDFYNHERPHQTLNYRTPAEVHFGTAPSMAA